MFSNQSTHLQNSQKQTKPLIMHTANPTENKSITINLLFKLTISAVILATGVPKPRRVIQRTETQDIKDYQAK